MLGPEIALDLRALLARMPPLQIKNKADFFSILHVTCWEVFEICRVFVRKDAFLHGALNAVHEPYHCPWQSCPGGLIPAPW